MKIFGLALLLFLTSFSPGDVDKLVIGRWQLFTMNDKPPEEPIVIVFRADHTLEMQSGKNIKKGTWATEPETTSLIFIEQNGERDKMSNFSVSQEYLFFTENSKKIVLKRIK